MAKNSITCPACGVEESAHANSPGEPQFVPLHEVGEFRCDACGARTVYGHVTPHLVVSVTRGAGDMPWIRIQKQDPKTREPEPMGDALDLDPKLAFWLVQNVISLVRV